MAYILPREPDFKTESERQVYNFIQEKLPNTWISYFNYKIEMTEFDILLIVPNKCAFVIEIKGLTDGKPIIVRDNTKIIYDKNRITIPSPLKQADGYRFKLLNLISKVYNKNPLIFSIVAYPGLSTQTFKDTKLNLISDERQTFLKEDFFDEVSFRNKIDRLYEKIKKFGDDTDPIDDSMILDIRKLFESEISIELINDYEKEVDAPYSIFAYSSYFDQLLIDKLIKKWQKGTKIFLVCTEIEDISRYKEIIKQLVMELKLGDDKAFSFEYSYEGTTREKNFIFNFNLYLSSKQDRLEQIIIEDGERTEIEKYKDFLIGVDKTSDFNLKQYEVEHSPINKDMLVRAGAGTGKTYSMIARIMFLDYAHNYSVEEFRKKIIMITFTNEAASNMKMKLQEYLQNLFYLNHRIETLNKIEAIEDMSISTIHSLTKKILQKYSTFLGLGQDLSIKSGVHERNRETLVVLNEYIEQHKDELEKILKNTNVSMYTLQKRIKEILVKLENKNVDIISDSINFGEPNENDEIWDLIHSVMISVTEKLRNEFDKKNQVRLSDLVIKLKQLILIANDEINLKDEAVDYLFVDEFQDTDDIQINLMRKFKEMVGFKFFVVGDVKQCIYRFRGAEKKAFDTLLMCEVEDNWKKYSLTKNYRTDRFLLDKYHDVFLELGKRDLLEYTYDNRNSQGEINSDKLRGVIELNNLDSEFFHEIRYEDEIDRDEKIINRIKRIKDKLGAGEQLAILVRENKQVEKIRKLCSDKGIYVYTDVGGDLYKIRPTIDLYKLVLALQNNRDPVYLFNLYSTSYIKSPLQKNIIMRNKDDAEGLLRLFSEHNQIEKWDKYIRDLKKEPIIKLIKEIINDLKPWENYSVVKESREERRRRFIYYKRNLEELIEKLVLANDTDYLSISKIKRHLEIMILTKQEEEQREFMIDADEDPKIVCLTIHKSKGLEFETVMMPYCDARTDSLRKSGFTDLIIENTKKTDLVLEYTVGYKVNLRNGSEYNIRDLKNSIYEQQINYEKKYREEEETRLLYVAMTRAIKNFVFFSNQQSRSESTWQSMIKEFKI